MGIYIEAIILYIVLFFSGSTALITGTAAQATEFSATSELVRILLYCIPSLALLWYMMIKSWKLEYWAVRPGKKDLVSGLITFPCLLIIGFAIAFLASYAGDTTMKSIIRLPSSILDWIVLCTSCLLMAYLEESYFRFYLLSNRQNLNLNHVSALVLSVALFSICHIYEGPWGFLNAVISGTFLCFMFLRYNSLHGIAIAHGLYNITAYILATLV